LARYCPKENRGTEKSQLRVGFVSERNEEEFLRELRVPWGTFDEEGADSGKE
jgi:hypothetical protein